MKSFKGQVQVACDDKWYDNELRFATHKEAEKYISDLFLRWTQVRGTRVVESDDPVNYQWDGERSVPIKEVS
jgi:hypothetical protein